jgi:tryptophanase
MHKTKILQKLRFPSLQERLEAIESAGYNTFLLKNSQIFLDMLTDSGTNAMSDQQLAAMMVADDSYAGSETFTRLEQVCQRIFRMEHFIPAHQGRACEHLLALLLVKPGQLVPMNYHFTTTKAHIVRMGGEVVELPHAEALDPESSCPFKGNMDVAALRRLLEEHGPEKVAFVRMEAGTNLIGGQPFSLANLEAVYRVCREFGVLLVLDASLLADNLYFIKVREDACRDMTLAEIVAGISRNCDVIYFSARKLGCARGGGIVTSNHELAAGLKELLPLFEGFLTYGGMSVREMEALAVGLEETLDEDMVSQGPLFIAYMVEELKKAGVPVVTPAGGLGCHLDARRFLDHIPQTQYPAGALAAALYIVSGIRGMERGTLSEQRNPDGSERLADMELLRLALPRRVFTLSQVKYAVDRIVWLHQNRHLVGGLEFVEEPQTLRFFLGRLAPMGDWPARLARALEENLAYSTL